MGIEYRLRFAASNADEVTAIVGRLPCARRMGSSDSFELHAPGTASTGPDATFQVEPCGAYYCWHGGSGREILGLLIARLVDRFGAVTVEDWE